MTAALASRNDPGAGGTGGTTASCGDQTGAACSIGERGAPAHGATAGTGAAGDGVAAQGATTVAGAGEDGAAGADGAGVRSRDVKVWPQAAQEG